MRATASIPSSRITTSIASPITTIGPGVPAWAARLPHRGQKRAALGRTRRHWKQFLAIARFLCRTISYLA
ncbi:MAG TPA: hypothetical protein VER17_01135 [Tepidisphaeraceae bacterium]|nr:hypothetical protein [Tepidisphaeraceae bacterium]